jgi:hypothetical protein
VAKPSPQRQQGRLAPRFDRLMQVAGSPDDLMALRDDPASIAPERAIVFEIAGSLPDFYAQARARSGSNISAILKTISSRVMISTTRRNRKRR